MKITVTRLTEEAKKDRDERDGFAIDIDGKCVFSAWDGEPEDNSLARNFNDCLKIPDILKMVFERGKTGETFEIEYQKLDDF